MVFYHGVIPCAYSFLKGAIYFVLKFKNENTFINTLIVIFGTIAISFGLLIIIPYILIIFILKHSIYLKYKEDFGSFLEYDTLLERFDVTVSYVYLIENEESYEEVEKNVKLASKKLFQSHYKFSSIIARCFGLYFYRKGQVNFNDVITIIDKDITTKETFINYLETSQFNGLNSKIKLWEVNIFKKPVNWNGCKCYPIVVQFNHSLGDGVQLTAFNNKYFLNDVNQEKFKNAIRKSKRSEETLKNVQLCKLLIDSLKINCNYIISDKLHSSHLALFGETESKYLKLIPQLSRKLGCTFTDVVVCALAESILNYLESKNISPGKIFLGNTCRELFEDKIALANAETLRNNVSLDVYEFINLKNEKFDVKLESWLRVLNQQRKTANFQMNYILTKIVTYLPGIMAKMINFVLNKGLMVVTNIPGADTGKIGSLFVKESYIFVNKFSQIKFIMSLYSFGGKLQASLISQKQVDITQEDLQRILENTFNNIDELLNCNNIRFTE